MYLYKDEVIGTLKLSLKGWVARDNDGLLIARSWRLRTLGKAVEAHVEAQERLVDLPF